MSALRLGEGAQGCASGGEVQREHGARVQKGVQVTKMAQLKLRVQAGVFINFFFCISGWNINLDVTLNILAIGSILPKDTVFAIAFLYYENNTIPFLKKKCHED